MSLFWTTGIRTGNNYGRKAAFLNWALIGNNNYSREAAAFVERGNK